MKTASEYWREAMANATLEQVDVISEVDFLTNLVEFIEYYKDGLSIDNVQEILTDRIFVLNGE